MASERKWLKLLEAEVTHLNATLANATACREALLASAVESHRERCRAAEARHASALAAAGKDYVEAQKRAREQLVNSLAAYSPWLRAPWSDEAWEAWRPASAATVSAVRVGDLAFRDRWSEFTVPLMVPLNGSNGFVVKAPVAAREQAIDVLQSVSLRLLAAFPPGQLRLTLIDPVGLGHTVAPFMRLGDYDPLLIGGRAWTETRHIEQQLADLQGHMENVIQQYLRREFKSIQEYNADHGVVA